MKLPKCDLLGIGLSVYDHSLFIDHHPEPDEKTVAQSSSASLGGPACLGTLCANRLGLKTVLISAVGSDPQGGFIRENQQEFTSHKLIEVNCGNSALATIIVKPDGKRSVIALPSKNIKFQPIEYLEAPKYILCDGRLALEYYEVIAEMVAKGSQLILDAGSANQGIRKLLPICNTLICSIKFAQDYTGETSSEHAFKCLTKEFNQFAVTMGKQGLLYKNNSSQGHLPAVNVDVINSNGAGDIFHGSFIAATHHKLDFFHALKKASEIAAWHCTQINSNESLKSLPKQKFF